MDKQKIKETFIAIPTSLLESDLPLAAKVIWAIADSFRRNDKECIASNAYLATLLGICEKTVSTYVAVLLGKNLIETDFDGRIRTIRTRPEMVLKQSVPINAEKLASKSEKLDLNKTKVYAWARPHIEKWIEYRRQINKPIISQLSLEALIAEFGKNLIESKKRYPSFSYEQLSEKIIHQAVAGGYPNLAPLKASKEHYNQKQISNAFDKRVNTAVDMTQALAQIPIPKQNP